MSIAESEVVSAEPAIDEASTSSDGAEENVPETVPATPANLDMNMGISPVEAMELHRRAQEIKNGYALLAMKQLENVFQGLDDENAPNDGGIDLAEEERKLNEAMAAYAGHLASFGVAPGSDAFENAMADLTAEPEASPPTPPPPREELSIEPPKAPEVLPYHNVWQSEAMEAKKEEEPVVEEVMPEPEAPAPEPVPEPVPEEIEEKILEPVAEPAPVASTVPKPVSSKPTRLPTTNRNKKPIVQKQAIQARPLNLAFTTFSAALPSQPPNMTGNYNYAAPSHHGSMIAPSQISLLPPDATALRVVAPRRAAPSLTSYPSIPPNSFIVRSLENANSVPNVRGAGKRRS
ncbi:hypothetical protein DFS34DRAFT_688869 [Phlyctochytrium arcticum]|nr:hypothetical protein DFS34DRAFT_688869 [Phlyctochytrium arcticum]